MSLLISNEELNKRLEKSEINYRRIGKGSDDSSRPRGDNFRSGIPGFVREIIAGEARAEVGSHEDIGKSWGVSSTTVKNIEDARVGPHELRLVDKALDRKANENALLIEDQIISETQSKILSTVKAISEEAVINEKPIAQSVIARNLATILDRLRPQNSGQLNVQFNVFTPKLVGPSEFGEPIKVIEVEARRK